MQSHVLRLVNHTHPAAAELLDDAVMRNGLTDHGSGQCYGGSVGQSMKVVELVVSQEGSWRKIAVTVRRDKPAGSRECKILTSKE